MVKNMFALAMPGRPEIFPFDDRAARFYRECGYEGVYFENDYLRFGTHATWGCWRDVNEVLSLWRFSKDPAADKYVDWMREQSQIARRHELKVYLKPWEPRVPCSQRDQVVAEARGSSGNAAPANVCISAPAGRDLIREFHTEALKRLDMIDGLIVGVTDNWAELCDGSCPHCKGKTLNDLILAYCRLLYDVVAAVRPELDVTIYDWGCVNDYYIPNDFVDRMIDVAGDSLRTVTRFTQFAHQPIPGYSGETKGIMDVTVAVDGPGPVTESYIPKVKSGKLRLLDMLATGNSVEFWAHPYIPAPGIFVRRWRAILEGGYDGFVDYDCGGMTPGIIAEAMSRFVRDEHPEDTDVFLRRLAEETYGRKAAARALEAWRLCEEAIRSYPLDLAPAGVFAYSCRAGMSMAFTIGLVPRLELFTGKDYRVDPFFAYPYSMLMPDVIDVQERQFRVVAENMTQSADALRQAADLAEADRRIFAQKEADRAEALAIMYASQYNWAVMGRCVFKNLPGRTPAEAQWVRQAFRREQELTRRYSQLHGNDRIIYSNPTWDIIGLTQQCDPQREIDTRRPFEDKIALLDEGLATS